LSTGFELHPQLLADCHQVGRLALSHVLLHRNAGLPWLILVPEVDAGVRELYELDADSRRVLEAEIDTLARYLKQSLGAQKINVAAIGNLVPQLHIHVVGRHPGDPCWPGVVWGNLPPGPAWAPEKISAIAASIAAAAPTAASPA
jgi:diadenosine tetraphosphate (Ap4A) HIT family hydrolase